MSTLLQEIRFSSPRGRCKKRLNNFFLYEKKVKYLHGSMSTLLQVTRFFLPLERRFFIYVIGHELAQMILNFLSITKLSSVLYEFYLLNLHIFLIEKPSLVFVFFLIYNSK